LVRFPVVILEQVPGILDVDDGRHLRAAIERLSGLGYRVQWRTLRCNRFGDRTSRRRVFVVAVQVALLGDDGVDLLPAEPAGPIHRGLAEIADPVPDRQLRYIGPVSWSRRPHDPTYDGPIKIGVVGDGGIGKHVYCAKGPAITQKTWGEGPGASTGLYKFPGGVTRRLSTAEAMRTHSFPETTIQTIHEMEFTEEERYRLVGNSIPVKTLRAVISHVLSIIDPAQIPELAH